jgi:SAM-dependent methyltransferase
MFTESAAFYDLIYSSFKDYSAEARRVADVLRGARPNCRTLLDVACGTAEHAKLLGKVHGFDIEGLDLDPAFLEIARAKYPEGRFYQADMIDFHLGRTYDAVVCLFSSIAYVRTLTRLRQALACFREHLADGGIVVVEPFFTPDAMRPGHTGTRTAEAEGLRVTRANRTELDGRLCRLHFEYQIEGPEGPHRATEVHELGLFTIKETLDSFAAVGLMAAYDDQGLSGRGLYVASPAA